MRGPQHMGDGLTVDQDRGSGAVFHLLGGDGLFFWPDVRHAFVGVVRRELDINLVLLWIIVSDLGRVAVLDIPTDVETVRTVAAPAHVITAKEQTILARAALQVISLMILHHIRQIAGLFLHQKAVQAVIAGATNQRVVARVETHQIVVAAMAEEHVVTAVAPHQVALWAAVQRLIGVGAEDLAGGTTVTTLWVGLGRVGMRMMFRLVPWGRLTPRLVMARLVMAGLVMIRLVMCGLMLDELVMCGRLVTGSMMT